MKEYKSHKIVTAAPVVSVDTDACIVTVQGERAELNLSVPREMFARGVPQPGDYIVQYSDKYLSWSPKATFEEGYSALEDLPATENVHTTGPDDDWRAAEETRRLRDLRCCSIDFALRTAQPGEDPRRVLARADTYHAHIITASKAETWQEQGFMAVNRAVFQPGRVSLPEDTWQGRLRMEYAELSECCLKLAQFLGGDAWDTLCDEDRELLKDQLNAMDAYRNILKRRVERLDQPQGHFGGSALKGE